MIERYEIANASELFTNIVSFIAINFPLITDHKGKYRLFIRDSYLSFSFLLQVKLLFEQISCDCTAITDIREIEIIQKYASKGRFYTLFSAC